MSTKIKYVRLFKWLQTQMPVYRFVRNLYQGHLKGAFSSRSHFTIANKEKVGYNTYKTARRSADKFGQKKGTYFSAYYCLFCGKYHIGRKRSTTTDILPSTS